ncbi:MAG: TldD/PmbA family protein [Lactobacillaceae bacterium]|jgi:PmbA protein|nr:TldD/PmbA family protein [Lactobacillaceae bacterium]
MNIEKFIDKIAANCKDRGLKKYQIVYTEKERETLSVFEQKVLKNDSSNNLSLVLSVLVNGKLGKFSTEKFDESEINSYVKQAIMNAEIIDNEDEVFFHDGSGDYVEVKPYKPLMEKLNKLDKVEFLKEMERKAYEADKRINKVISLAYGYNRSITIMKNSLGLNLQKENITANAYVYLSATNGTSGKTGSDFTAFEKEEDFNADKIVKKAVKKAVSRLGGVNVKSKKTRVVFNNETFGYLLDSISSIFSIYSIDKGYSKLQDKVGKKVAGRKLTILDNPHLKGGLATVSFDNEGYPTISKEVIKNGMLKTFLYNLSLAHKYGTKSTGNGAGGLHTRVFNFYVEKGYVTRKELLKILGEGVYIDGLNGIHAGIDIVSGDFSLGAEGFLVEGGKIAKPLNQFTISGNVYELLNNVEEIANDLEFKGSNVGSPSVLVDNITIASN